MTPCRLGNRICQLHLCRGEKHTPNGATCWPWVVTCKALGQDPGGWAVIDLATEWSMTYNMALWPLLGLTEKLKVKHKRNVSFLEARKIVGTYMRENSYTSVAQRADRTNKDNKYRTLMEKLIQLEANDWPKFQEHLKKLLSRILQGSSSATSWEWGEIQCCSPNKNTCRIYHSNTN